jgi:hypothetical protein
MDFVRARRILNIAPGRRTWTAVTPILVPFPPPPQAPPLCSSWSPAPSVIASHRKHQSLHYAIEGAVIEPEQRTRNLMEDELGRMVVFWRSAASSPG